MLQDEAAAEGSHAAGRGDQAASSTTATGGSGEAPGGGVEERRAAAAATMRQTLVDLRAAKISSDMVKAAGDAGDVD